MTSLPSLIAEFAREGATTRRMLERIPPDRLEWRPHPKSFTAGGLASHLVECVGWAEPIFAGDELDFDPSTYQPYEATSVGDLLAAFDDRVARGQRSLEAADHDAPGAPWRFKMRGKVRFERTRADVFRDFALSHQIHHRGQLSVYLRLLDVAVPGAYGPTADEGG